MPTKIKCTKSSQNDVSKCDNLRHNATSFLYDFQKLSDYVDMKISVVLETRRQKANGKFPVKIRFNYNNQAYYVSTRIDVPSENFQLGKIVGLPKASMMNNIIAEKLDYTQRVLQDLQQRGIFKTKFKTGTEVKNFIEAGEASYIDLDSNDRMRLHFQTYTLSHMQKYTSRSSFDQYRHMLAKVTSFTNIESFFLTDITVSWLKDFDKFCDNSGMSVNGKAVYMRAIRTIFNDAIDRELISPDKYPFRRFKIKTAKTAHRNVTIDDLRYMLNLDMNAFQQKLREKAKKHTSEFHNPSRYVDLFFLSFYFCGMNIKDILFLRRKDIRNNQISILREKTGEPILLRVEPEAWIIIDRYPGKKYLLDFLDNYSTDDYRSLERRMNENLKLIFPFLTNYWARHSWATIASELDVPDPIIDLAQGRTISGISATYIHRNIAKITEANRKVINFLHKQQKKSKAK